MAQKYHKSLTSCMFFPMTDPSCIHKYIQVYLSIKLNYLKNHGSQNWWFGDQICHTWMDSTILPYMRPSYNPQAFFPFHSHVASHRTRCWTFFWSNIFASQNIVQNKRWPLWGFAIHHPSLGLFEKNITKKMLVKWCQSICFCSLCFFWAVLEWSQPGTTDRSLEIY